MERSHVPNRRLDESRRTRRHQSERQRYDICHGALDTPFTWESTPALVTDVQSWLDSPATNFGWLLFNRNESTIRSLKAFYSRDATQNSSNLPDSLDPSCAES